MSAWIGPAIIAAVISSIATALGWFVTFQHDKRKVLYYTQITTIAQFIDDLRSDRYQSLDKDRKIQMYEDYVGMKIYARELAEQAMDAINASLAFDKRVNNRVLARSDH